MIGNISVVFKPDAFQHTVHEPRKRGNLDFNNTKQTFDRVQLATTDFDRVRVNTARILKYIWSFFNTMKESKIITCLIPKVTKPSLPARMSSFASLERLVVLLLKGSLLKGRSFGSIFVSLHTSGRLFAVRTLKTLCVTVINLPFLQLVLCYVSRTHCL